MEPVLSEPVLSEPVLSEPVLSEPVLSNPVLRFRPDTVRAVRAMYGLDGPGRMEEVIDQLHDWVKKQDSIHIKDFSRQFLENTLLSSKGCVERARLRLERYSRMRVTMSKFFEKCDVNKEFQDMHATFSIVVMPKAMADYSRVIVIKYSKERLKGCALSDLYKFVTVVAEYMKLHDYFNGVCIVVDYTNFSMLDLITKLNPIELSQASKLFMDGYGARITGIHMLTQSTLVHVVVPIIKSVLSSKLGGRIRVHRSIESVHEAVPRELLPEEYGGDEKPTEKLYQDWTSLLGSEEHVAHIRTRRAQDEARRAAQRAPATGSRPPID